MEWLSRCGRRTGQSTSTYDGIVGSLDTGSDSVAGTDTTPDPPLRNFAIPKGNSKLTSASTLEFLFSVNGTNLLCCARVTNPYASNWYQDIVRWPFDLDNIVASRGSVTIPDTIIDPSKGEQADLTYTISTEGNVTINVFDLTGDLANTLERGLQSPGH